MSKAPSARLTVWPSSGWWSIVIVTPGRAPPSRFTTLPRITAARCCVIVFAVTPVWIGFTPTYRNCVEAKTVVETLVSLSGATEAASGGNVAAGVGVAVGPGPTSGGDEPVLVGVAVGLG